MLQKTVKESIEFCGIGLHTGCVCRVRIEPSGADSGITFIRKDIPSSPLIKADPRNVVSTRYATTLGVDGVTVSTVEHLMAALYGLGVDNCVVEVEGPEIPIMDGSARDFVDMIEDVGFTYLDKPRWYLVVERAIRVYRKGAYVLLLPSREMEFSIDYSIDFRHPFLKRQTFSKLFSRDVFKKEIVMARTFGFLEDVKRLRSNGLAKGGSLNNAIVIGEKDILNKEGLRYPDELVRHKVLDIMGDIALLGMPVIGSLVAYRSGHTLNHRLTTKVLNSSTKWKVVTSLTMDEKADRIRSAPLFKEGLATV